MANRKRLKKVETYKRQIKFCYYKVCMFTKANGVEQKEDFDLATCWLASIVEKELLHKTVELSDTKVNFDKIHKYDDNVYVFRVFKLRDSNIPSAVKDGEEAKPLPLEEDEYIGEDMTVLYDWENSICMVQQNRMSVGIARLTEWINKDCGYSEDEDREVAFVPIAAPFTRDKLKQKYIRAVEFSFANMELCEGNGSLSSIINCIGKYKGLRAKIEISVGRGNVKDAQLNPSASLELIEDIQNNPGSIGTARAKLKSMSDDDKARTELVDIFETSLHDYIEFKIEVRKPLKFELARAEMYDTYRKRREEILQLC